MKRCLLFTVTLLVSLMFYEEATGQNAPAIQWQKKFGGGGVEQAKSITQCTDGGYIIAGYTTSANNGDITGHNGSYDYWVVKLTGEGNIEWQKALGGSGPDWASSIQQTIDGGYVVAGYTTSNNGDVSGNHGDYDYWVVKLSDVGFIEWQKAFGGLTIDQGQSIKQCTDGGYIVAGSSFSIDGQVSGNHGNNDYWVVRLDSVGNLEWQKSYGGTNNDMAREICQTADGGYIVIGSSNSSNGDLLENYGGFDYWLIKLDSVGGIQWQKKYGGTGEDEAYSVQQTTDGGYVVAGYTTSTLVEGNAIGNHGAYDYWILKLDHIGSLEWQKTLGGSGVEEAHSIYQSADGGYVVAGFTNSNDGNVNGLRGAVDYWVVKLGALGEMQWQKTLGGSGTDQAYSVSKTQDGGCILAGYSTSNDIDASGNYGNGDYWIVKLSDFSVGVQESEWAIHTKIFPNPTRDWISIESDYATQSVLIYNVLGELIQTENKKVFSVAHLATGTYIIQLRMDNLTETLRFIKTN